MALNPPGIEKRIDGADMEAAILRPHFFGWLAWIPAFAGMTAVLKVRTLNTTSCPRRRAPTSLCK
jgi:hypothetical protein